MWEAPLYSTTKVTIQLNDIVNNGDHSIELWKDCDTLLHPDYIEKFNMTEECLRETVTNHFLFRQIGFETVGRFLHEWRQKTREISSYYKNMTYGQSLLFSQEDPLESYHLIETFDETNEGTSSGTGSSGTTSSGSDSANTTDNRQQIYSDTPQGSVNNIQDHMSNATVDSNSANTSSSSSAESSTTDSSRAEVESTIKRTLERRGNIGVQPLGDEVKKYQDAFDNMVETIIKEYEPLFLRVY